MIFYNAYPRPTRHGSYNIDARRCDVCEASTPKHNNTGIGRGREDLLLSPLVPLRVLQVIRELHEHNEHHTNVNFVNSGWIEDGLHPETDAADTVRARPNTLAD